MNLTRVLKITFSNLSKTNQANYLNIAFEYRGLLTLKCISSKIWIEKSIN